MIPAGVGLAILESNSANFLARTDMFAQLVNLIVGSLCDFLAIAFLARFVMQWARLSWLTCWRRSGC